MLKKYLKHVSLLAVGLILVSFILNLTKLPFLSHYIYYIVIFLYVFNVLVHYALIKLSEKKMQRFTAYYMGATLLKLMVYFAVILMFAFFKRAEAVQFIITFFVFYLIFTAFEVLTLQKNVRKS